MAIDTARRLGYGGSAEIDATQVLITSGNFDKNLTPSYLEPLELPPADVRRSRIRHAAGTHVYTGSISFDVTEKFLAAFDSVDAGLLQRFYEFKVGINDGEDEYVYEQCRLTSMSLSAAPAGLIAGTISVMARDEMEAGSIANNYILDDADQVPIGYWWSGNTDVREWTFTMNQDVTPVYINENQTWPKYLKCGLVSYSLDVVTYTEADVDAIDIRTKSFTLTGDTTSNGYSYGGQTGLGMYSHSFETAAVAASGSSGIIIV
jgi:hypothetical protein